MKNKTIYQVLFIAFMVVAVMAITILIIIRNTPPEPVDYTEYVVKKGDTLWTIAKYNSNGYEYMDTREIVRDMAEKSECGKYIYPGETVYVPQYEVGG